MTSDPNALIAADPTAVQVEESEDGKRLWVHVDGQTVLRVQWYKKPPQLEYGRFDR